jgi:hypothetical protein
VSGAGYIKLNSIVRLSDLSFCCAGDVQDGGGMAGLLFRFDAYGGVVSARAVGADCSLQDIAPDGRGGWWTAGYGYGNPDPGGSLVHWTGAFAIDWGARLEDLLVQGNRLQFTAAAPAAHGVWLLGTGALASAKWWPADYTTHTVRIQDASDPAIAVTAVNGVTLPAELEEMATIVTPDPASENVTVAVPIPVGP